MAVILFDKFCPLSGAMRDDSHALWSSLVVGLADVKGETV